MSSEDDEACGTSNIELPDHGVKEYTFGEAFSEPPLVTVNEMRSYRVTYFPYMNDFPWLMAAAS